MHTLAEVRTVPMHEQFETSKQLLNQRLQERTIRLHLGKGRFEACGDLADYILERGLKIRDFFEHVIRFDELDVVTRETMRRYIEDGYQTVTGIGRLEIGRFAFADVLRDGWPVVDNTDVLPGDKDFSRVNEKMFRSYGLFPDMSNAEFQAMMHLDDTEMPKILRLVKKVDTQRFFALIRMAWVTNAFPVQKIFDGGGFFTSVLSDEVVLALEKHLPRESVERFFERKTIHSLWHNWSMFPLCAVAELKWLFEQYGIDVKMSRKQLIGTIAPN